MGTVRPNYIQNERVSGQILASVFDSGDHPLPVLGLFGLAAYTAFLRPQKKIGVRKVFGCVS